MRKAKKYGVPGSNLADQNQVAFRISTPATILETLRQVYFTVRLLSRYPQHNQSQISVNMFLVSHIRCDHNQDK